MPDVSEVRAKIASVPHWHHIIEVAPGVFTPGAYDCRFLFNMLDLPGDLTGKRVLDVGARDGFYSFELEKRGAEVVAVDYIPANETGFATLQEIYGSKVTYLHANLLDLRPEEIGRFDIVLFLGVLYHLRDPLYALDVIHDLCADRLYLETHVCDLEMKTDVPVMRFYPGDSLAGDFTNYWGPNTICVQRMLEEAQFAVRRVTRNNDRSVFDCQVVENKTAGYYKQIARSKIVHGVPVT